MRRVIVLALCVVFTLSILTGCGQPKKTSSTGTEPNSNESANNEKFVIKMGYGTAPGAPIDLGARKFKEEVEKKSNGRIEVRLFPSAQLGSERQLIEGLQAGTIEMTPTTTGPMGLFDPAYYVFDLPYIFKDTKSADKVLDGPIGEEMLARLEKMGIIGLAWWENGFRQFTNNKRPIVKPQDINGMKIRSMENEVHMKFFKDLGATPIPLGFGEIYMACKSKTVDGQENPTNLIATNKFYEVQKYMTVNDWVYSPVVVLISKKVWNKLPEDLKKIVKDAALNQREFERNAGREKDKEYIETIKKGGTEVTVLTDEQKMEWRKEAEKLYPEFESKIGKDLLEKVQKEGWVN
jgi:tripartite ATP-independent transporter DctP family solute receptor